MDTALHLFSNPKGEYIVAESLEKAKAQWRAAIDLNPETAETFTQLRDDERIVFGGDEVVDKGHGQEIKDAVYKSAVEWATEHGVGILWANEWA